MRKNVAIRRRTLARSVNGKWVVGIDVGGTNVKVGLVSPQRRVVRLCLFATQTYQKPDSFVVKISEVVQSLLEQAGLGISKLEGIGIGLPGPVDVDRGIVHSCVNIPAWQEFPLRRILKRRLNCEVFVDNDVNVTALGVWMFGSGRGFCHLVCVTIGTGVGGGLILHGSLYRGSNGSAGEIGHMAVNPRGRICACGARGCLETEIGSLAIMDRARKAVDRKPGPLRNLARKAYGRLTPDLVCQAASRGDAAAKAIWDEVGYWLGVGLANLVNLLNPDGIVIGGGIANAWKFFSPVMMRTLRTQAMTLSARTVRVVRDELGSQAGILGATVLVQQLGKRGLATNEDFFGLGKPG